MSRLNDQVASFSRGWVDANIFPGPHSMADGSVGEATVEQFVGDARHAGLSRDQLVQHLGDLSEFLQRAFAIAHQNWKVLPRS